MNFIRVICSLFDGDDFLSNKVDTLLLNVTTEGLAKGYEGEVNNISGFYGF
jgi:hypothetical protein